MRCIHILSFLLANADRPHNPPKNPALVPQARVKSPSVRSHTYVTPPQNVTDKVDVSEYVEARTALFRNGSGANTLPPRTSDLSLPLPQHPDRTDTPADSDDFGLDKELTHLDEMQSSLLRQNGDATPSSLLDLGTQEEPSLTSTVGQLTATADCPWMVKEEIGRGKEGIVFALDYSDGVEEVSGKYVAKVPLNSKRKLKESIDSEKAIMNRTMQEHCTHTAEFVDATPCLVYASGRISYSHGAYVTKRMKMDLYSWRQSASEGTVELCASMVAEQLSHGLQCLHRAGLMHGDFKADNVLVGSIDDETKCPQDLLIADYGQSHELNQLFPRHNAKYFDDSFHLPSSLFESYEDTLGICQGDHYKASASVDWCSYVSLLDEYFNHFSATSPTWDGNCGPMGYGRNTILHVGRTLPM